MNPSDYWAKFFSFSFFCFSLKRFFLIKELIWFDDIFLLLLDLLHHFIFILLWLGFIRIEFIDQRIVPWWKIKNDFLLDDWKTKSWERPSFFLFRCWSNSIKQEDDEMNFIKLETFFFSFTLRFVLIFCSNRFVYLSNPHPFTVRWFFADKNRGIRCLRPRWILQSMQTGRKNVSDHHEDRNVAIVLHWWPQLRSPK